MFNVGDIVISKQGHDNKELFVIIDIVNENFVLISDGVKRTINSPKLKNKKHLRSLSSSDELAKQIKNGTISDNEIVNQIKKL